MIEIREVPLLIIKKKTVSLSGIKQYESMFDFSMILNVDPDKQLQIRELKTKFRPS